jgi:hypothetical protein
MNINVLCGVFLLFIQVDEHGAILHLSEEEQPSPLWQVLYGLGYLAVFCVFLTSLIFMCFVFVQMSREGQANYAL